MGRWGRLCKMAPVTPSEIRQTQAGVHSGTRAWRRFSRLGDGSWRCLDGHVTCVPCSAHLVLPPRMAGSLEAETESWGLRYPQCLVGAQQALAGRKDLGGKGEEGRVFRLP